ncbi:MAG: EI24 domain-containing protein, partial [Burkholderiaceae bacterium]
LWLVPMVGPIVPIVLLGWATAKVFAYDALAEHADAQESAAIRQAQRWPLFGLGVILAMFSSVPTLLWLGGALVVLMLPVMALLSVWLYGAVFVLSGLAFAHFCLAELARLRSQATIQSQEQSLLEGAQQAI